MIKIKKQYRIVTDNFSGFEVQKRIWYFPFWIQLRNQFGDRGNTQGSIKKAEELIDIDKNNSRAIDNKSVIIKIFDWE